jgi:hypothetical protein
VVRTEGEEFLFGVIDHVFAPSARAVQTSSSQTTAVRRGEPGILTGTAAHRAGVEDGGRRIVACTGVRVNLRMVPR